MRSGRDDVDAALVFDRAATSSLQRADDRLSAASAQYELWAAQNWSAMDVRMAQRAVDRATEAQSFASSYQARCRAALGVVLDRLSDGAERATPAGEPRRVDADGAAGIYAATVIAASLADAAVTRAVATVSRAVDDAQLARTTADGIAANAVALTAARAAADVKRRADQLAGEAAAKAAQAITRVSASSGADSLRTAQLMSRVSAAAAAKARETAAAATIVGRATAAAAAMVVAQRAQEAAATRLDVARAATAVRAVADATAKALADVALGAEVLASDLAVSRRG